MRSAIAGLYSSGRISADDVITTTGTTGANSVVLQTLLNPGDHAICLYPTYPQLLGLAEGLTGGNVSYWRSRTPGPADNDNNGWKLDLDDLRGLIKPSTKLIVLNNPNNPTGWHFDGNLQRQILEIARENDIVVVVDEIFWPLFQDTPAPSFGEHDSSRVIVTSSVSKVWGMSGVRVGWIVCRDGALRDRLLNTRQYTFQSTSAIDEVIATEVLSERCRPVLLKRHLGYAAQDLGLLDAFVEKNKDICSWTRPVAGATAFVRVSAPSTGQPLDDVDFCRALLVEKGVLLSPGSLCFGGTAHEDFKGYVRVHTTVLPDTLKKALGLIDAFLDEKYRTSG